MPDVGEFLHELGRLRADVAAARLLRPDHLPALAHAAVHAAREAAADRGRTRPRSVTWDDVAGVEEAQEELQEVVDFLRDPKRFQRLGARVPKGILLYGPPGTGKTLLAKAVANESGANFYSQSASAFVEMFAGLGAARIRKLFAGGAQERARDRLHRRARRRRHRPHGRRLPPRARPDAEPAPRRARRLRRARPGRRHGRLEPAPGSRPGAAPPRPLRPAGARLRRPTSPAARRSCASTRAASRSPTTSTSPWSRARPPGLTGADLANICNEAAIFAGRQELQHDPAWRTSRPRWSASSPACSSGAS